MTGDRSLRPHEKRAFMQHGSLGIDTIKETLFTGGEPSLFEVALIEIIASLEAHRENIIDQGAAIKLIQREVVILSSMGSKKEMVFQKLEELDGKLEEHTHTMIEQVEELRQITEEFHKQRDG
jgi:hypothetical protein